MKPKVKPIGDHILIEPAAEKDITRGGIVIPDAAKEQPSQGIVRAVGTGKRDDEGRLIPIEVKVGDRVLMAKYAGTEVKLDGKDYKIVRSDDLLALFV